MSVGWWSNTTRHQQSWRVGVWSTKARNFLAFRDFSFLIWALILAVVASHISRARVRFKIWQGTRFLLCVCFAINLIYLLFVVIVYLSLSVDFISSESESMSCHIVWPSFMYILYTIHCIHRILFVYVRVQGSLLRASWLLFLACWALVRIETQSEVEEQDMLFNPLRHWRTPAS